MPEASKILLWSNISEKKENPIWPDKFNAPVTFSFLIIIPGHDHMVSLQL